MLSALAGDPPAAILETVYLPSRSFLKFLILVRSGSISCDYGSCLTGKVLSSLIIFLKPFQVSWHCSCISFSFLLRSTM